MVLITNDYVDGCGVNDTMVYMTEEGANVVAKTYLLRPIVPW